MKNKRVSIVDYGLGNLYSIEQACKHVGLDVIISSDKDILIKSDALILPGVGAFGDAMTELKKKSLVELLQDHAKSGKILIGICLGMQLLMSESKEFGVHRGLDIISGTTCKFEIDKYPILKVPQIGWNNIVPSENNVNNWNDTLLNGLSSEEYMYFVHSFYVETVNPEVVIASTDYGNVNYCSALQSENIYGFQFHPERSGPSGLKIYKNLKKILN